MRKSLGLIFVIFIHLSFSQSQVSLFNEAIDIEYKPNDTFHDLYVLVNISYKNSKEICTIARLSFLYGALQIENKKLLFKEEGRARELSSKYEKGFNFNKRKAYRNVPQNHFTRQEIAVLEKSEEFKAFVNNYYRSSRELRRVEKSKHNSDSVDFYINNDFRFFGPPDFHCDCNHYKLIQLLWSKGVIVEEARGAVRTNRIYDEDIFFNAFKKILEN